MIGFYLTHPQVAIDPAVPVPRWGLSETGRARAAVLAGRQWVHSLCRIVSSAETKAVETATLLAAGTNIPVEIDDAMGENDRSSTGFLDPVAFEAAADRFFAAPHESWNGWERAVDAQTRIVAALERLLEAHDRSLPVLLVGHGAVGTLLQCHIAGRAIARAWDQPAGGGNIFAFRLSNRALLCDWTPMERFEGAFDDA